MVSQVISHYRILNKLGEGGMGEVYLAEDIDLERQVALKLLRAEVADDEDRVRRFVQEAKAASALNHPNILTVHEVGSFQNSRFIATEFVKGRTLHECLLLEPLTLNETLDVALQVAAALSAAHGAGIVHRDIKPENIMLRDDGLVKVLDFGLAKLSRSEAQAAGGSASDEEAQTRLQHQTRPGTVMGTVLYMSPEQARGKEVDARSDIWSLGVVLYEMIAGRTPFAADTMNDSIVAILTKNPPPLEGNTPAELQRIIRKSLQRDADERYQTIKDLQLDLKNLRRELDLSEAQETQTSHASGSSPVRASVGSGATGIAASAESTQNGLPPQRSSAEYLVNEIKSHKRSVATILTVLLAVLIAGGYWLGKRNANASPINSIAVMPFVNEGGNVEVEYLSDGMTETLIKSLSQLPHLNVKSRSSVFRYKGKETDPKTIGKELNVEAILTGRVVQRAEQLTVSLELINAQTENVIWTDQYDRKASDLVALQNLIARDVSSKLKIQLSGADLEKLAKNYTNDPEAFRLYLQGRFYWNKRAGKEFERAEDYFQQAVARDPNFALGYIGLADFKEDNDRPRKKEYIRRALEIDDQLAEAHASLGYQYMMDYNWAESERELKRAIELNPNYPQAHQWNGMRLMMNGKIDAAQVSLTRAIELDLTSPGINLYYGVLLEVSGRINESIQQSKKLIEMEPTFPWPHIQLARDYRRNGNHEGCVDEWARSIELSGNEERAKAVRESFATGGWKGYLREFPNEPSYLAELGEYEKAIEAVVKQAEPGRIGGGRFWFFLNRTDPFLDPIRDDPRFKEAMKNLDPPQ